MTVADILAMEVYTEDGEDLGNPDAIVEVNGTQMLVISEGGFLGLGEDQVAVPMSRVSMDGDRLVLQSLTEDDIEEAGDFEFNDDQALADDASDEGLEAAFGAAFATILGGGAHNPVKSLPRTPTASRRRSTSSRPTSCWRRAAPWSRRG